MGFALGGSFVSGLQDSSNPPELSGYSGHKGPDGSLESSASRESDALQLGTRAPPLYVQVIPTPKSAQERAEEKAERDDKKNIDKWLVRWTASLVLATIGMILATGVLAYFGYRQSVDMKESIALTAVAAKAAQLSSAAALATERALIFASFLPGDNDVFKVSVINAGKTPATLENIWISVTETPPSGIVPCYLPTEIEQPLDLIVRGGGSLNLDSVHPMQAGHYCYGYIKYIDVFRGHHIYRFSVRISNDNSVWKAAGPRAWNEYD
jgi:hypothetical protein